MARLMKFDKEDLLYSLDLMYEQSKKAPDCTPIHKDRFKVIRKILISCKMQEWQ